jgi:RNA polymerase sigma-70 factor (ECF subfamily)
MNNDSNSCTLSQAADPIPDDNLQTFIQVAEQHRNYLTKVAGRMTKGTEDAEDIVQQALLKAFINLSRFRGDAKMKTWLHTIVLNTAREHLRNQKRCVPLQPDNPYEGAEEDALRDLPDLGISPEDLCEQSEIAAILHSEVAFLTPACKHTLELSLVHDLPQHAIARKLNTNVATVKSRVYRAKAMLRRALELRMQPRNTCLRSMMP